MSNATPNISIPVDLTNPGQFFACCGLFELADRLWPGAEAWFESETSHSMFQIVASRSQLGPKADHGPTLRELLVSASALEFDVGNTKDDSDNMDEGESDSPLEPIGIQSP